MRLMALIGRSTRTVRIADRLRLSELTAYSTALVHIHTAHDVTTLSQQTHHHYYTKKIIISG